MLLASVEDFIDFANNRKRILHTFDRVDTLFNIFTSKASNPNVEAPRPNIARISCRVYTHYDV